MTADLGTPQEAARHIRAALVALGIKRFDLMGEQAGAAAALWLGAAPQVDIGSVVLAAPDGFPDEAFREIKRQVLVLFGTNDKSDAGGRYCTLLPIATSCLSMTQVATSAASGRRRSPLSRSNSLSGAISSSSVGKAA
jgi:hypothetical protein